MVLAEESEQHTLEDRIIQRCDGDMELLIATLAMLVVAVLWLLAFRERQRANPDQKIPQFSTPPSSDGRAFAYLMLGALLLGGVGGFSMNQIPLWAVPMLPLAVVTPYAALIHRHNRQIDQRDSTPAHHAPSPAENRI